MKLSAFTVASGFPEFSDPGDSTYEPSDLEDDEREVISKHEMDYIVAKMLLSQQNAEFLTTFLKKKQTLYHCKQPQKQPQCYITT